MASWSERRKERVRAASQTGSKRRPGAPPSIPHVYAFLAVHPDGDEGLVAGPTPLGMTPLVATHKREIAFMKHMAQRASNGTGSLIRLVRFGRGEVVETIRPEPGSERRGRFEVLDTDIFKDNGPAETIRQMIGEAAGPGVEVEGEVELPDGGVAGMLRLGVDRDGNFARLLMGDTALNIPVEAARMLGERLLAVASEIEGTTTFAVRMGTPEAMKKGDRDGVAEG